MASEKDTAWKQKEQELEALRSELTIARAEQAALVAEKAAYQRQALVEQQSGVDEQTARQRHLEGHNYCYHAPVTLNLHQSELLISIHHLHFTTVFLSSQD